MKAAIISQRSISSKWIFEAMKRYFEKVDDFDIRNIEVNTTGTLEILYKGKKIDVYDCIYIKGSFRYRPLMRAIATAIHGKIYTPISPSAFTTANDKILTQLELQKNKIPMPKTYLASSTEGAKRILEDVNYPIILKFPSGTQGKGVMIADSPQSALTVLDAMSALKQPVLIQEYIETGGIDTRVIVVGEKVAASMCRESKKGDVRSNIHAGGTGKSCELDFKTKKIAIDASKVVGAEICGVDILQGIKGPMVIEINLSPGLQGIIKATKIDVADKIASYLYEQSKVFQSKGASKIMEEAGIKHEKIKEMITNLDFRGERILLPAAITSLTRFNDKEEYVIKAEKGSLSISKFSPTKEEE